jgi:hypothetical protein
MLHKVTPVLAILALLAASPSAWAIGQPLENDGCCEWDWAEDFDWEGDLPGLGLGKGDGFAFGLGLGLGLALGHGHDGWGKGDWGDDYVDKVIPPRKHLGKLRLIRRLERKIERLTVLLERLKKKRDHKVPEPSTGLLLGAGLAALIRRRY